VAESPANPAAATTTTLMAAHGERRLKLRRGYRTVASRFPRFLVTAKTVFGDLQVAEHCQEGTHDGVADHFIACPCVAGR